MAQQQGTQANSNGRHCEDVIMAMLMSKGYASRKDAPTEYKDPFFVYQCRGVVNGLYGKPLKVDFYVWHPSKHPRGLIIESKYQETPGSVDEKFPYTVGSLKQSGIPAVLLIVGPGPKPEAVAWCQSQQTDGFSVFTSLDSFLLATNKGYI